MTKVSRTTTTKKKKQVKHTLSHRRKRRNGLKKREKRRKKSKRKRENDRGLSKHLAHKWTPLFPFFSLLFFTQDYQDFDAYFVSPLTVIHFRST